MWFARQVESKELHVFETETAAEEHAADNAEGGVWVIWEAEVAP